MKGRLTNLLDAILFKILGNLVFVVFFFPLSHSAFFNLITVEEGEEKKLQYCLTFLPT